MSNPSVDTTDSHPAATALSNDETVNEDTGDQSLQVKTGAIKEESVKKELVKDDNVINEEIKSETVKEEATSKQESNGTVKVKEEDEKTTPRTRSRTYENGMLKTSAREEKGGKNSKYDPSVLPQTDDPKKIRAQVCIL